MHFTESAQLNLISSKMRLKGIIHDTQPWDSTAAIVVTYSK